MSIQAVIDESKLVDVTNSAGVPLYYWDGEVCHTSKFWGMPQLSSALQNFNRNNDSLTFLPGDVVGILTQGTYVRRNQRNSNRVSKHSYGIAIDFGGLVLKGGRDISYDMMSFRTKTFIEVICSLIFGVVLTESYNKLHWNHLHLDLSYSVKWRGGKSQIQVVQRVLNAWHSENLTVDGILGPLSIVACKENGVFEFGVNDEEWQKFLTGFLRCNG